MKTRNLSLADFLNQLEIEYLQADFRRAIHHSPKNKRHWKKVMEYKKEKIIDISRKCELDSIFDSLDKKREICELLFPNQKRIKFGFELSIEEMELYYSLQSSVKVEVEENTFRNGKIVEVDLNKKMASIVLKGSNQPTNHLFSKIIRVF